MVRMHVVCIVVLVFSLSSFVLGQDCKNPLGVAQGVSLSSSYSSGQTGTCPETILNGVSCCSQTYFDSSQKSLQELYDKYSSSADYFVAMVTVIDDVLDNVYSQVADKVDNTGSSLELPSRGSSSSDPEVSTITTSTWQDISENMDLYIQKCHQDLFDIGAALRCLSCDPNYKDYMETIEGSSGSFRLYADISDCKNLQLSCADAAEVMTYFNHKLFLGLYIIMVAEWTINDFADDYEGPEIKASTVNYLSTSYSPEDDWEEADLSFKTLFDVCVATDGVNEDFLQEQMGIWGPSVYELMLNVNNYKDIIEEMIAYGDGDSNAFESSRRRSLVQKIQKDFGWNFEEAKEAIEKGNKERILKEKIEKRMNLADEARLSEERTKVNEEGKTTAGIESGRSRMLANRRTNTFEVVFDTTKANSKNLLAIASSLGTSPTVEELFGVVHFLSLIWTGLVLLAIFAE